MQTGKPDTTTSPQALCNTTESDAGEPDTTTTPQALCGITGSDTGKPDTTTTPQALCGITGSDAGKPDTTTTPQALCGITGSDAGKPDTTTATQAQSSITESDANEPDGSQVLCKSDARETITSKIFEPDSARSSPKHNSIARESNYHVLIGSVCLFNVSRFLHLLLCLMFLWFVYSANLAGASSFAAKYGTTTKVLCPLPTKTHQCYMHIEADVIGSIFSTSPTPPVLELFDIYLSVQVSAYQQAPPFLLLYFVVIDRQVSKIVASSNKAVATLRTKSGPSKPFITMVIIKHACPS